MEQLLLYRDTRDSILAGQPAQAWGDMSSAVRERALQREMRADCNLHPALCPPEEGPAILGHYKVRASARMRDPFVDFFVPHSCFDFTFSHSLHI